MVTTVGIADVGGSVESSSSAVSWGPIFAGAFAATTATMILTLLGSGLGLTMVSPWSNEGVGVTTFGVSTAIGLVVVQWLSAGFGGYLTGRLRTKWVGVHTDETFFRDTAHGFLAWAVATVLIAGVLGSAISSVISGGVSAATTVASGAAMGAAASADGGSAPSDATTGYFVDSLFRPSDPARLAAPGAEGNAAAAGEASRILVQSAAAGEVSAEDRTYLGQLVAARTGLSQPDAEARVQQVIDRAEAAKVQAQEAVDTARQSAAAVTIVGALALILGAFIASAAAALGGRQRDDDEVAYVSTVR